MTRYEKSDAQLDAEAQSRKMREGAEWTPARKGFGYRAIPSLPAHPAAPPVGLEAAIELHREMMRDDARIDRLVSRQPPTTRDPNTGIVHQHDAAAVGMNMSARLYRYVEAPGSSEFPWRAAFRRLRFECRRNHPYHTGPTVPYWRGSLCQELVRLVIIGPERRIAGHDGPMSVQNAAEILRYDNPEPVLRYALSYIEATIDEARRKAEKRLRDDEGRGPGAVPAPEWRHHAPSDEHVAECPNPICRERRAA